MSQDGAGGHDDLVAMVEDRLLADDKLPDDAKYLVLAAMDPGTDEDFQVAAGQDGGEQIARRRAGGDPAEPAPVPPPARVYLRGVEAEGFRGIGPAARLDLRPGPGLTVVAGRNGCGKSSLAEAAEVAITGTSHRWTGPRPSKSWRNLHHRAACRVSVALTEEGVGDTTVQAEWDLAAEGFEQATAWVQRHGRRRERGRESLGWVRELTTYKPFLSHAELGEQLAQSNRTHLYSAINTALGLERVDAALGRLDALHSQWNAAQSESDRERKALRALLQTRDDDRSRAVYALLAGTRPDLSAVAAHVTGKDDGGRVGRLRRLIETPGPEVEAFEAAVAAFRAARTEAEHAGDVADQKDLRRRELLRVALVHYHAHGPGACPVCANGTLDDAWMARTTDELDSADLITQAADRARAAYQQAAQRLARFRASLPLVLKETEDDLPAVAAAVAAWRELARFTEPGHLASEEAAAGVAAVVLATADLRAEAAEELARVQDDWQPLALRLGQWLEPAHRAARMRDRLEHAKAARAWMRAHADEIRNERLAPINDRTQEIWNRLRQNSNVSLGPLRLRGARNTRHVVISAAVDDDANAGMEVMSQGELNALALAIFLPRVQLAGSPFGFVMIDDPVQAMDPAKVDGLAQVLADLAETRQVVVFTHDDRLPEAITRLQIPASILLVGRDENSAVVVRESSDPVSRYLRDARAIARDEEIPLEVRRRVVPRLCRDALERRCKELFFRRELRAGAARGEVERRWQEARETRHRLALVVNRPGETTVDRWLEQRPDRRQALGACSTAVHRGWDGDLAQAVRATERATSDLEADHGRG
jgi:energy-coupling factor transporter ATP-binding protein EcfA2